MLIRVDSAGGTHAFLDWLTSRRLSYSVGFALGDISDILQKSLTAWPAGMRVIARKEGPHPGAQLRLIDLDGHRITAFATNTRGGQLPDLELPHRRRARAEDRIRNAKDLGLANLPLHYFAQNRIWCAIVGLAGELIAWMQLLALTHHQARRREPKRLRYRLFSIAVQLARTGRQTLLHLPPDHPGPS